MGKNPIFCFKFPWNSRKISPNLKIEENRRDAMKSKDCLSFAIRVSWMIAMIPIFLLNLPIFSIFSLGIHVSSKTFGFFGKFLKKFLFSLFFKNVKENYRKLRENEMESKYQKKKLKKFWKKTDRIMGKERTNAVEKMPKTKENGYKWQVFKRIRVRNVFCWNEKLGNFRVKNRENEQLYLFQKYPQNEIDCGRNWCQKRYTSQRMRNHSLTSNDDEKELVRSRNYHL